MQMRPLESLPLFAWAASVHGDLFVDPAPCAPARKERDKPLPPPASEIWIDRPSDIPAEIACAAFVKACRDLRDPPKPVVDPLAAAILACPRIARAIGRPDIAPPTMQFQSAAWIERLADRVAIELAYQGPKEHLADTLDALAGIAKGLGLIARTATASFSVLRADTAKRGEIGWRVRVAMVEPIGQPPRAAIRTPGPSLHM